MLNQMSKSGMIWHDFKWSCKRAVEPNVSCCSCAVRTILGVLARRLVVYSRASWSDWVVQNQSLFCVVVASHYGLQTNCTQSSKSTSAPQLRQCTLSVPIRIRLRFFGCLWIPVISQCPRILLRWHTFRWRWCGGCGTRTAAPPRARC